MRNPLGGRQGVNERIMLRELLRRVDMMVLLENHLDVLVRLHTPLPPALIGSAGEPARCDRRSRQRHRPGEPLPARSLRQECGPHPGP